MSEASPTKQKLDEFRASLPPGDEHTEPTREMLRVTSYACNGAPDKQQALADAVGGIGPTISGKQAHIFTDGTNCFFVNVNSVTNALTTN